MTIGRAILEQGRIPSEEFYIFTRLGDAARFHEWGFGLIYQLIFELANLNGIIIFNALTGALTVFVLFLVVRQRVTSLAVALSVAAIGFWLMEFRFVQRPENFLYLAVATTLYLIELYRRQGNWRFLCAIPFLGLALSQIHPSAIMIVLVTGTYFIEAIARSQPNIKQAYQLGLVIVFTFALSLINPYGIEQIILPIKFSLGSEFLQNFTEFFPSMTTVYSYRFIIAILLVLFSLTPLHKRFSLAECLILIAFSYLAYQHVRDLALLGIALALPLATTLEFYLKSISYRRMTAIFILIFVAVDSARFHRLSFDIDPSMSALSGAETVAQYSRSSNILNFYHLGNYLAWRLYGTHKVIIDGRNFQDNKSIKLHDALLSAVPGWQKSLQRYDIDAVVTPATLPYSGDFIPLAFELIKNSDWVMMNNEPAGVVFIRRDRVPGKTAVLPERELWLQARSELIKNLSAYPTSESSLKNLKIVEAYLNKN